MSDNLAPLFADRATRLQALPDSERSQFQTLEQSSGDPMYADRQFSALWMSKRTGLPHAEILKNFDQLSAAYFGEGTTAAQAYERIAETYKPKEAATSEQADDALSSSGSVISKDFAGSFAMGMSATGYGTLGGVFSMLSAASGITLKKPDDRPDFQKLAGELSGEMIADYRSFAASQQNEPVEGGTFQLRKSGVESTIAKMASIRAEVKAENDAAMIEFQKNNPERAAQSEAMRLAANAMYELANAPAEDFGVSPEFAGTMVGQFVQSAGSLPATALFAYMGPVVGGAATTGLIYSQVEQDRKAKEGDAYDPTGALFSNLASAGPQAAMEYAFGMERVMNKVIKDSVKVGGRISFKEGVKAMARAAAASGLEEGITNPAQSLWDDVAANLSYDEGRELFTPEKFKQRLIEAGSGAALGFLFGGPVQALGNMDRNRAVAKADRYLTTREGGLFTPYDFNALRIARTDEEIKAMAPDGETGDLLLKAAAGDVKAQAEYNKTAQQKAFIDTDGVSVEGVSIGKIGEQLALRNDDGTITVIDTNDPEQLAFFNQVKADAAIQVQATEQTLARLQGKFGEMLDIQRPKAFQSLAEMVKKGELTEEQANDALGSAQAFNGLVGTLTLDNTAPTGKASAKQRDAVWRMAVQVLQGASPDVAVEEVSEAWVHKGIKDQNLTFEELHALRADWYAKLGEQDPSTGKGLTPERSSIEWFSKRVVEYALANRKVELPGGWGKWLRTIGGRLKEFLGGAIKMKGMLRRGEVAPKLEQFMREALGVKPEKSPVEQVPMQGEQGGLMSTFSLAQTETPEFKKWFKDSKVVDAQGNPLIVYHGTKANFKKFNMKKQIQGIIWFTSNKAKIEAGEVGAQGSGKILDMYASIQNPAGWDIYDKRGLYEFKGLGYDGAILPDGDGGFDGFVFKSEQLKSATKNKGTFDPANPDITFSLERKPAPAVFKGYQENVPGKPPLELFNLTEPILGRPTNSTVSRKTLEDGGYDVPVVGPEPMTPVEAREQAKFDTFAIPQNKRQAYAQKMAQFAAKNAANFPYPYHLLATQVKQAQVSLGGHQMLINALQSGQASGSVGKAILPMSERLRFMVDKFGENIGILTRARRYEFEKATLLKKYSDMVTPLMHGLTQMNAQDLQDWSVAASNQEPAKRDLITAKYKLGAEWEQYESARGKLRAEMLGAGIDVGLIEEYFPRWCKDYIAFRASLGINVSDGPMEQAVIEAETTLRRALTNEELNEIIDKTVRGIGPRPIGGAKPSNTKGRTVVTIQPDQWAFYADANHALSRWLEQSTEAIARYRFFGKDIKFGGTNLPASLFNANESVGAIIAEQLAAGNIRPDQQQEIIELLSSYFSPKGMSSTFWRGTMDLTYLATMGQFKSVLAQVPDVVTNIVVAGPWNTFVDLPRALLNNVRYLPGIGNVKSWSEAVGKATQSKTRYSREELGVTRMLEEFKDPRKTAMILNEVFTGLGFNFVDGIFKDVLMNAKLKQLSKAARGGSLSTSDTKMINGIFGTQGAANVIADLKAGVKTDDTKFLAFNVLADWHPINLLEYPEYYARAGNWRVLYALKIYSCKMLAAYRREGQLLLWFGDAKAGTAKLLKGEGKAAWNIYTQDMSQKAAGARKLTALVAMLFAAGFSKDWIVDFMLDRDPQPDDIAVDNMFKLLQVSRYAVWKSRNRAADGNVFGFVGTGAYTLQRSKEVLTDIVFPPTVLLDRPAADLGTWAKSEQTGDPIDFWGLESIKFIPGAGDPAYWYSDTGRGKIERRRKLRERAEKTNRRPRRRD